MRIRVLYFMVGMSFLFLSVACVAQASIPNYPPVADPNGPYTGTVGVPVTFDGTGSSDPDGDPLTYEWDFGDGSLPVSDTATPSHTYSVAATYSVKLTVTDDDGLIDTAITTATITEPDGVPEFPLAVPILTSLVAALYLVLRKRIAKNLE